MMERDEKPTVATSGTIDRDDRCSSCDEPMLYAVDRAGKVHDSFCGNADCLLCGVAVQPTPASRLADRLDAIPDAEWLGLHLRSAALAELRAVVMLLEEHRTASVAVRLSSDRDGVVRVRVESFEGVNLGALLTKGVTSGLA